MKRVKTQSKSLTNEKIAIPYQTQATLASLGMKIRKNVSEGYKVNEKISIKKSEDEIPSWLLSRRDTQNMV
jgi:hypothetical protein